MQGPDVLDPYILVRVQQRMRKENILGALAIEPSLCRVTFRWVDGRTASRDTFPSLEIANAVIEADILLANGLTGVGKWLEGIAIWFEPRAGVFTVVERAVLSVPSLDHAQHEIARLLGNCFEQSFQAN